MTKQEEFNRIKAVIENPKNTSKHLGTIRTMIDNFQDKHGIVRLTLRLKELQTDLIKKV